MAERKPMPPTRRTPMPAPLQVRWEGVFESYSRAFVAKNFWRVRSLFLSEEDALQECALIWTRCRNYYQYRCDNPAWFMSLYKIALINDFNTFAQKDGRRRDTDTAIIEDAEAGGLNEPISYQDGPLMAALAGASSELKEVLAVIAKAPAELLELILGSDDAATTNRRMRRVCGIKGGTPDLLGELRSLIS